jgi:pyruvate-formate lyase
MLVPISYGPKLTVRVSDHTVNIVKLSREQQEEIISRTIFVREAVL